MVCDLRIPLKLHSLDLITDSNFGPWSEYMLWTTVWLDHMFPKQFRLGLSGFGGVYHHGPGEVGDRNQGIVIP